MKKYTLDVKIKSEHFELAGMLETYGNDLEQVIKLLPEKRVWTLIAEGDDEFLLAGYHYVNRIAYVITNEEYDNTQECLDHTTLI